jgi:peptidoglycan/xylan/chitin deacetylase (PgdA/CDA1 family)
MIDAAHIARKTFFAMGRGLNLRALAPRSFAGVGGILMLHRVSPHVTAPLGIHAGLSVTPGFLDELFPALGAEGYDFIPMDDVPGRIANPTDRPFLAVTFDDGYTDNFDHGYPVLRRHNVPWTVYIAPGLINGDSHLWWEIAEQAVAKCDQIAINSPNGKLSVTCGNAGEKIRAFNSIQRHIMNDMPEEAVVRFTRELAALAGIDPDAHNKSELMDWDQIRAIARDPLCTIGTHTLHHYHLARLDETALQREFSIAMNAIEAETGLRPKHVAYPYGYKQAVGPRETGAAQAFGYETGVTTRHGMLFQEHRENMTALPRISVNGKHQNVGDVKLMLSGLTSFLAHRHGGPVTL